jgi:hypothetical protein
MSDILLLPIRNAGFFGTERVAELLLSIRSTEAIVGLSATFSSTHSNPMWMHLSISVVEPPLKMGSTIFKDVPCLQFFHAYKIIMWANIIKENIFYFVNSICHF